MVIPKTRNGNGTFRTEKYFKLKHGNGTNFSILNTLIKKIFFKFLFRSMTKTRKTSKYGTCCIPFFSHQAKTRNGTIKSMSISMCKKKNLNI
jgi:hypothetical protein